MSRADVTAELYALVEKRLDSRSSFWAREVSFDRGTPSWRRIDYVGRVVIPKEIRRTLRIREGDPLQITLARWERFCFAMLDLSKRLGLDCT